MFMNENTLYDLVNLHPVVTFFCVGLIALTLLCAVRRFFWKNNEQVESLHEPPRAPRTDRGPGNTPVNRAALQPSRKPQQNNHAPIKPSTPVAAPKRSASSSMQEITPGLMDTLFLDQTLSDHTNHSHNSSHSNHHSSGSWSHDHSHSSSSSHSDSGYSDSGSSSSNDSGSSDSGGSW